MAKLNIAARERKKIERLAKKAKKWICSKEGRKAIKEAILEAKEISDKFKEASLVNWKIFHEPIRRTHGK